MLPTFVQNTNSNIYPFLLSRNAEANLKMYIKPFMLLNVRNVLIFFCSYLFPSLVKALIVLPDVKAKPKPSVCLHFFQLTKWDSKIKSP